MVTENAQKLLEKRYFQEGEKTWSDIAHRVAKSVSKAEDEKVRQDYYKKFYDMINNMYFIPSTPCLLNANEEGTGQLSSCFIISLRDNIESIYDAKGECAKIFQKNGGVGFNISVLRPVGSTVETSKGYSCGTIGFMEEFDLTADVVTRNNVRKGAIKIDLNDWHPDIYKFIHCKDDITKFKRMNISVLISDKFMKAVENDEDWILKFPDYHWNKEIYDMEWNGDIDEWERKGYPIKVYKIVKARDLYNEIMESAWKTGEPGVSFKDAMERANPNPSLGKTNSTNPCLHKDTYMVTENGLEKISKLESKIWNGKEFTETKTWRTGVKKVIKIMTKNGFEYITTPDHKFLLEDGTWCEAQNLIGKNIKFEIQEKEWKGYNPYPDINYEVLGFEFGDGSYHKASKRMKYVYANPEKDKEVIQIIESVFNDKFKPKDINKTNINHYINIPYGTVYANAFDGTIENRMIPDWIMKLPKKEMKDFLRGLFSANGSNLKRYNKIQLVSINTEMLKQVQQMLLLFGIKPKLWYHNKRKNVKFNNGEYTCKQSAHLILSRDSYKKFLDDIGFIQEYKNGYGEYKNQHEENFETVILIFELDKAEVWDFTESKLHMGVTNGAYVHNCSEFVSIPYNSCNLGSINLTKFVVDGTKYDFNKLQDYIRLAVRFIDDMITVNKLPLRKIEEVTKSVRSVGLGVMGLADTLYMIKIPYNSEQAKKFIEFLFYIIQQTAIDTSMELAQEKGVYKHYKNSVWYKMGIPMRNSNLLSIAPTGSISFIANVSQSIEPNYALTYRRKTNEGDEYIIVNEIFKNELIKRGIYSDDLINKIIENNGSCQGIDEIPKDIQEVFLTTYDLTPKEHVDVVKIIQKYVDLSISKTINLKQDTTLDDMKEIYLYAWKAGLKGITVYRDGSRDNVLSTKTNSKEKIKEKVEEELKRGYIKPAPKESLNCKTVRIDTGCGTMYLTMTKDEEGNINQTFISRGSKGTCVANQTAVSRLLSIGLRGGIPLEVLIDQLLSIPICASYHGRRKEGLPVSKGSSCPSAVAYELLKFANESKEKVTENKVISNKNYEFTVKEIQENKPKNICPECGNELQYEGGCVSCVACGFSKCN